VFFRERDARKPFVHDSAFDLAFVDHVKQKVSDGRLCWARIAREELFRVSCGIDIFDHAPLFVSVRLVRRGSFKIALQYFADVHKELVARGRFNPEGITEFFGVAADATPL